MRKASVSSALAAACAAVIAACVMAGASPGAANETVREPGKPVPKSGGLDIVNYQRSLGKIAPVTENAVWSAAALQHSKYMVATGEVLHMEDPNSPHYTPDGDRAARLSNLAATSAHAASESYMISLIATAPFHAAGMLDPNLTEIGYGIHRDGTSESGVGVGITLDISSGNPDDPWDEPEPVLFPADGIVSPNMGLTTGEWPNPLLTCDGYETSPGAPVYAMLPEGEGPYSVRMEDQSGASMEFCTYDGKTYENPNAEEQRIARYHLDARNMLVVIPKERLANLSTYTVAVTTCSREIEWSFGTAYKPETYTASMPQEISAPRPNACDVPPVDPEPEPEPPTPQPEPIANKFPTIDGVSSLDTKSRRPVVSAKVYDRETNLSRANIVVKLDGRTQTRGVSYSMTTDRLTFVPSSPLKVGRHEVKITATDMNGLSTVKRIVVNVRR